jgi:hypothetical protein
VKSSAAPPAKPPTPSGAATSPVPAPRLEPSIERKPSEKGWQDGVAAAPKSPALARAKGEALAPLDLALAGRERGRGQRDALLPEPVVSAQSFPVLESALPTLDRVEPSSRELPRQLPDLPLPAAEALAWSPDEGIASPRGNESSRSFAPVFTLLAIPEPGSAALLGAALAALAAARRRGVRRESPPPGAGC